MRRLITLCGLAERWQFFQIQMMVRCIMGWPNKLITSLKTFLCFSILFKLAKIFILTPVRLIYSQS